MSNVSLYHGDCLELLKDVPSKSVNMVLCDLPYGTTRNKWDSCINLDALWIEYKRVLAGGGAHPTQKPVLLLEWLIKTYTNEGDTVLDNTMGSGSTGVACVNTGRNFIGMELNADYFATAQARIKEAQGALICY